MSRRRPTERDDLAAQLEDAGMVIRTLERMTTRDCALPYSLELLGATTDLAVLEQAWKLRLQLLDARHASEAQTPPTPPTSAAAEIRTHLEKAPEMIHHARALSERHAPVRKCQVIPLSRAAQASRQGKDSR